jgi:SET domain-containing protein
MNVAVVQSKIQGRGLFAQKDFKKGEMVLDWNEKNKYLSKEEVQELSDDEKRYVALHDGKYLFIAEPERHMNHSCDPNTETKDGLDFALRDIKKGEEITGDYDKEGTLIGFSCNCRSDNCRKFIAGEAIQRQ